MLKSAKHLYDFVIRVTIGIPRYIFNKDLWVVIGRSESGFSKVFVEDCLLVVIGIGVIGFFPPLFLVWWVWSVRIGLIFICTSFEPF